MAQWAGLGDISFPVHSQPVSRTSLPQLSKPQPPTKVTRACEGKKLITTAVPRVLLVFVFTSAHPAHLTAGSTLGKIFSQAPGENSRN